MTTERIPNELQTRYDEITALTDAVCGQHLTDEYRDPCRRMAATLCRKRLWPLVNGPARSWACGIAYAVGRVNFLFDRHQTPHMRADVLCEHFRVSPKTGSAKAGAIITLLKIGAMDPRFRCPVSWPEIPWPGCWR
ncbi:DUF6398 domain-containing protein [Paraburkholderia azotifigens]|uniref:DUF6398 domain-containing protein n=1 Tax=Paraburkholderia azotifigens TaxID=2057004 RepID=UPI003176DCCB